MNSILNPYCLPSPKRLKDLIFQKRRSVVTSQTASFPWSGLAPPSVFQKSPLENGSKTTRFIMIRAWSWCPPIQENTYATL